MIPHNPPLCAGNHPVWSPPTTWTGSENGIPPQLTPLVRQLLRQLLWQQLRHFLRRLLRELLRLQQRRLDRSPSSFNAMELLLHLLLLLKLAQQQAPMWQPPHWLNKPHPCKYAAAAGNGNFCRQCCYHPPAISPPCKCAAAAILYNQKCYHTPFLSNSLQVCGGVITPPGLSHRSMGPATCTLSPGL